MSEVKNNEQNNNEQQQTETTPYRRAFTSKEDFMKYYNEHKEDMDKLTTKQLNSAYVIESCKITRNKNKIVVRSNSPKNKENKADKQESKPKETKEKKQEIKPKDLSKMIDSLINQYEKQLTQLRAFKERLSESEREMKNKIVSDACARQEHHNE